MVLGWFPCGWSDGWRVGLGVVRWGWDGHASVGHNRAEEPPPHPTMQNKKVNLTLQLYDDSDLTMLFWLKTY